LPVNGSPAHDLSEDFSYRFSDHEVCSAVGAGRAHVDEHELLSVEVVDETGSRIDYECRSSDYQRVSFRDGFDRAVYDSAVEPLFIQDDIRLDPSAALVAFRDPLALYDLVDIVEMARVDDVRVRSLKEAVDNCIVYKAATQSFMGSFDITAYSGFSMYLPSNGNLELDKYYRTLKWNIATGLIQ
jgi:hypothetical protein